MKTKRYHPVIVTLHWLTVILLFISALLSKQKDMDGMPLNLHMILRFVLLLVMTARVVIHFVTLKNITKNPISRLIYYGLYLFVFIILGTGGWIAHRRNLLGFLIDPNSAFGRGGFKLIGDFHIIGWQVTLGFILLHVGTILYRQFQHKDDLLSRMWFGK